ncbi:NAD(P)/FAD-dependent oxidoreductase [Actinophytocola sp.]|uniref:FAD-dependent oxidoreductase n=1 Tax=Actinophytocola sp. TaxID=1872138 RepID=UPI002D256D71|nr:NAD(P)/FAD-dependent oxidoreductase [Actinophytocola sp.]HYQ63634.1 NAD(P)/FAD-dependent oxidoreductase [Actinophytocola sp.]
MQVTVAGGGVAGTVSAIALRRIGADVTVYETYPDAAGDIGGFISLASNGLRALDAAGLEDAVRAHGVDVAVQRMWAGGGKLLGENPRGRRSTDPRHSITIRRADLVATLREAAAAAGVRLVTGERVTDATPAGDGVRVTLASGNTVDSDLLVGADGLWSTVRTILDADAPRPEFAGILTVFGTSTTPTPPGAFNMIMGRGGAFAHLDAGGTTWWAAQVLEPDPDTPIDLGVLRDRYRQDKQALTILDNAAIPQRPTRDHVLALVPTWHNDRIVLVGDAAHPVGAGQGASMAIEDTVVLAQRLATDPALAAYDAARRDRIGKMLKAGHDNRARKKAAGPVRRRVTDAVMSFGLKHFYEKATGWLYHYDVGELPVRA